MPANTNKMSKADSSRIQSTQAKGGKDTSSSSFASRAQSAGDKLASAARTAAAQKTANTAKTTSAPTPTPTAAAQAPKAAGKN